MIRTLIEKVKPLFYESPGKIYSRAKVRRWGTIRQKERMGLLDRPNYAYGLLRAADLARYLGLRRVTVCEFGVATGDGLLALINLSAMIAAETGIDFRIVGFDTGEGLPRICGYADHPEIWSEGDFPMSDRQALVERIDGRAELIFGDIEDTVSGFVASLTFQAPLGFAAVDVDIYSGAKSALRCLLGAAELYLPAVTMYFDDISFFFANRWCGELRAIEEFNQLGEFRKIDCDRSICRRSTEKIERWYSSIYICHILDHEYRSHPRQRREMTLEEHIAFMRDFNLI